MKRQENMLSGHKKKFHARKQPKSSMMLKSGNNKLKLTLNRQDEVVYKSETPGYVHFQERFSHS